MKRIIKTYETCSDELLGKIAEAYPDGIKPRHLQKFTTHKGENIKVVELVTDDTMYFIKFSEKLGDAIDNFDLDELDADDGVDLGDDEDGLTVNVAIDEKAEAIPDEMDDED